MRISERDRRALSILGVCAVLSIGYWWFTREDTTLKVVGSSAVDTIPAAEKRLSRVMELAAMVPGKEQVLAQVKGELAAREKNLIQADTAAQAQAQILQIIRNLAKAQTPPIELRNTEIGQVKPFGENYGEVFVAANFDARIEQLVQLMADITARKELIGSNDLRIGTANPKQKTMPVRLTLSGLVRKELIPDRKGASF